MRDALCHVHLRALGIRSGRGRDQDAFTGAYRQPAVGSQFEATATPGTAGGGLRGLGGRDAPGSVVRHSRRWPAGYAIDRAHRR
ncbi:MAG: hypothetical protein MZV70_63195 [Desulfobacterales bacterium]|nr:hypothetical protein [Desulfobacterales bacterium]